MKPVLTILAIVALVLPSLGQSTGGVDMAYDKSQPGRTTISGQLTTYALGPGKACTTKTYLVGNKGGFSFQYACSLKATGDSALIAVYSQLAHYDTPYAFNAYGMDSLVNGKVDTILKAQCGTSWPNWYWSHNYDYTNQLTRGLYERTIIYNLASVDSVWLRFFPAKTLDAN